MRIAAIGFAMLVLALTAAPAARAAHGYDVFRPWSAAPSPCPGTCGGALDAGGPISLKAWYDAQAAAHPALVQRVVYGHSRAGAELVAYRAGAAGAPAALYVAGQHARDWLGVELERRLFAHVLAHPVAGSALWFVPVVDPDAYDDSFGSKAARLAQPVDLDRNWPERFHYDEEGSGADRGAGPGSEPAVAQLDALLASLRPAYLLDYQAGGGRILYPESWQIATPATDAPVMAALAGDDDHPAIAGYDPDAAGETAIANGTLIDHAYARYGTQAFTVALADGSGPGVGGTVDGVDAHDPGGAVFQDSEAAVEAEFAKGLEFALDLARSAPDRSHPLSHLHATAPDFVPHGFGLSYGSPQVVEVNARRALGDVRLHWRVDGAERSAALREYAGGERYGAPGAVYHRLRGSVRGFAPGDRVEVWFEGGRRRSASFDFTAVATRSSDVLVLAAEDYSGTHPLAPHAGPQYLRAYTDALDALGARYDVYDVDARGRVAPDALGVLSHYAAVVWYTGDDVFVRDPLQPPSTGVSRLLGDEVLAVRDYLNDGGKLLVTGRTALQGAWRQLVYNPLAGPYCQYNNLHGLPAHDHPLGQLANCVPVADDFMQYYLGAWQMVDVDPAPPYEGFQLDSGDAAEEFVTTSSMLDPARFERFASAPALRFDRPERFTPSSGTQYAYAASTDEGYARLKRTIDLTGASSARLRFNLSFDTEPDADHVFVEAHEVGQDDWTTLPDANGHTSTATGVWCEDDWASLHPFLDHYIAAAGCARSGATGAWNAASGSSGGFQAWDVDLSAWAGRRVEVSIAYAQDYGTGGLGAYVDDVRTLRDGATVELQDFEHGLGAWDGDGWVARGRVVEAPAIATDDTLLWGFGLENVTGAATRARLLGQALTRLRPPGDGPPTGGGGGGAPVPPVRTPEPPARTPRLLGGERLRADAKGRVRVRIRCAAACRGVVRLSRSARVLARKRYRVAGGRDATVRLTLSHRARRSLARARSLRVTLTLASGSRILARRAAMLR
jgi:hypothetical protein